MHRRAVSRHGRRFAPPEGKVYPRGPRVSAIWTFGDPPEGNFAEIWIYLGTAAGLPILHSVPGYTTWYQLLYQLVNFERELATRGQAEGRKAVACSRPLDPKSTTPGDTPDEAEGVKDVSRWGYPVTAASSSLP